VGFENDILNREKYADFLTEIVGNPEKYKRISDSKSLSIAIDSSWGTGKTTFIDMWKDKLEGLKNNEDKEKFIVIKYNAWKNDFVENPFESLVYTIINHRVFNDKNAIEGAEQAGKNLLKLGIKLGKILVKLKVSNQLGEEVKDAVGKTVENLLDLNIDAFKYANDFLKNKKTKMDNFFEDYKEYLKTIEGLKEELGKVSKKKNIIIIVDELDRCKPLFAIRLLESVKHIFDVPNVSFVFALDMEQLSHSIKCIYGQNMDASGYLCRFFDYISKMPKADTTNYIKKLIKENPLNKTFIKRFNEFFRDEKIIEMSDVFEDFSRNMNLSLRDINTIYANFKILEERELKNVECIEAYSLYLMLLILKYKHIEIFNKIFLTNNCDVNNEEIFSSYTKEKNIYFDREVFYFIMKKDKIEDILFSVRNKSQFAGEKKIYVGEKQITYRVDAHTTGGITLDENVNISNCLFYDDIKKWDKIKNKPLVKYIQEKLEFFDFEWENKMILETDVLQLTENNI